MALGVGCEKTLYDAASGCQNTSKSLSFSTFKGAKPRIRSLMLLEILHRNIYLICKIFPQFQVDTASVGCIYLLVRRTVLSYLIPSLDFLGVCPFLKGKEISSSDLGRYL